MNLAMHFPGDLQPLDMQGEGEIDDGLPVDEHGVGMHFAVQYAGGENLNLLFAAKGAGDFALDDRLPTDEPAILQVAGRFDGQASSGVYGA